MQQYRDANSMIKSMLFLSCLVTSTIASSAEYYFCVVFDVRGEKLYYYSDILVANARIDDNETFRAFTRENERREIRDFNHVPTSGYCIGESDLSETEKEYRKILDQYPGGRKYPFTSPPVPSKPYVRSVTTTPSIIIEETKPVTPTPEQLAERAAQERKAAANRARMAADAARHDAKVQAAIAEQLRLRKSQGARQ